MGYYVSSRGGIDLPEASLDAVWADLVAAAAENRVDLADADNWRAEFGVEGMIAVVIAAAIGSDCPRETWERGGNGSTVHLEVWGDGDVGEAMEVLSIVAAGGGTGVIYSDSDGSKWRWRLEDGEAHDETGRTCYGDEVDATAWVVQLQRPGQGLSIVSRWWRRRPLRRRSSLPGFATTIRSSTKVVRAGLIRSTPSPMPRSSKLCPSSAAVSAAT
ncbi:hypothetical protein GCM10020255_027730 [Rhodococcus baikonurensis]